MEDKPVKLLYDGEIETAVSHAGILLSSDPESRYGRDKLALARNLQVCREAIKEAVKSATVAKDGRVWISRDALEVLKGVLPE